MRQSTCIVLVILCTTAGCDETPDRIPLTFRARLEARTPDGHSKIRPYSAGVYDLVWEASTPHGMPAPREGGEFIYYDVQSYTVHGEVVTGTHKVAGQLRWFVCRPSTDKENMADAVEFETEAEWRMFWTNSGYPEVTLQRVKSQKAR